MDREMSAVVPVRSTRFAPAPPKQVRERESK